ncbi:hypothetical protein WDW37_20085 [Bdellovibrionota bacterium FG-1]
MLIKEPAAGFKRMTLPVLMILALFQGGSLTQAGSGSHFHLERDSQGLIRPFKTVAVPLPDFLREYARLTATPISVGGSWDQELKGTVTVFLRRPLKPEALIDLVHRILNDNGYAMIDAPAGNGWVVVPGRKARDRALPVYELAQVPDSSRLVTVFHTLKYANSEDIARMLRSFMPANSRIIPAFSQITITDIASNIHRLVPIIARMDTPEVAQRQRETPPWSNGPPRACGEQRIEKLVVEKLEIQDSGNNSQNARAIIQVKPTVQGVRK